MWDGGLIGCIGCGVLCAIFLLLALLFVYLGEKSAMLMSGFNTMPRERRDQYDKARMSKDQMKSFLIWAVILGVGALLSLFVSPYLAIVSGVVWLIVFFKDVQFDSETAFEKYRKS